MANTRRKAAAIEALQGNPGKRAAKKVAKIPPGKPTMPAKYAKVKVYREAWRTMAGQLAAAKVLTLADGVALEMLTEALVSYRAVEAQIKEQGYSLKTKNGYEQIRPSVTMLNIRHKQLKGMLEQFGMTPASRNRAERSSEGDKDPLTEFLRS